jgi:YVTN family beta-propeller protein
VAIVAIAILVGAASEGVFGLLLVEPAAPSQPAKVASTASTQEVLSVAAATVPVPHVTATLSNVYAATMTGQIHPAVADIAPRVYVPNSNAGTVDVIDPATFQVVDHLVVGGIPHHVAPAWDLSRLYIDIEATNALVVIDPRTGRSVGSIPVMDPYNLYFTPDGSKAIVVAEVLRRLDFRDPHSWQLIRSVNIPWPGVDHLDFSADGTYLLAGTEYSGIVVKVDTVNMEMIGAAIVGGLPIDVRVSPDGSVFYVANQGRHGVSVIDPVAMKEIQFLPTGAGAHGLQVSRDTRSLYVSNRLAGSISVIDFATRRVTATWNVGGSPDMLQLSPDGRQLWASGRFEGAVYVIDTTTGTLVHKIRAGAGAHGLSYFPNAGLISTGHNGVYR